MKDPLKTLTIFALIVSILCLTIGALVVLYPRNDVTFKLGMVIVIGSLITIPLHIVNLIKKV